MEGGPRFGAGPGTTGLRRHGISRMARHLPTHPGQHCVCHCLTIRARGTPDGPCRSCHQPLRQGVRRFATATRGRGRRAASLGTRPACSSGCSKIVGSSDKYKSISWEGCDNLPFASTTIRGVAERGRGRPCFRREPRWSVFNDHSGSRRLAWWKKGLRPSPPWSAFMRGNGTALRRSVSRAVCRISSLIASKAKRQESIDAEAGGGRMDHGRSTYLPRRSRHENNWGAVLASALPHSVPRKTRSAGPAWLATSVGPTDSPNQRLSGIIGLGQHRLLKSPKIGLR